MTQRILIVQENGRHEQNRNFRECFCLQRAFRRLGVACEIWGAGHPNEQVPFAAVAREFDTILSLENYNTGWHPDLSGFNQQKLFWCIDAHMGVENYRRFAAQHRFDVIFNSSEPFVPTFADLARASVWLPNALDETLIDRQPEVPKTHFVGFCGNVANRGDWIRRLQQRWGLRHDEMVLGPDMVRAINGYRVHWNRNLSVDINFRTFETLGCGTLLITNPTPGLEKLFTPGEDLLLYRSAEELDERLTRCREHPEEGAAIAARGYQTVRQAHTYIHRAQRILELMKSTPALVSTPAPVPSRAHPVSDPQRLPLNALYGQFVERFARQDYDGATPLGEELARRRCLEALDPIFGLSGATFRAGRNDLSLRLVDAQLQWLPDFRPARELRQKLVADSTYRTTENPIVPEVQVQAYQHFAQLCGGAAVVEVGCGTGLGTQLLTQAGARVTATDIEATCLDYARQRYGVAVDYRQCSGTALPFADRQFDYAICIDVIEHIPDFDAAIAEMRRVSRRGVLISTPNRLPENTNPDGTPKNYWHQFEWSPEEITRVLQRHFDRFHLGFIVGEGNQLRYLESAPPAGQKIQALVAEGWVEAAREVAAPAVRSRPTKARRVQLVYAGDPKNDQSIRAPETIANHLYRMFESKLPIVYRDWLDQAPVDLDAGDLVFGHPHYHPQTSVQQLFRSGPCVARCLVFPFHHAMPDINLPFAPLVQASDRYFAITGEYWQNTLPQSAFADWGDKLLRLDMAVDIRRFPRRKKHFHPAGRRVLFYVGTDVPEKGVAHLARLVRSSGSKLVYAGSLQASAPLFAGLDVEFWGQVQLTPETLERIARECDFFVNTSVSDANPTTLLEMAATGLPVLCTPQSGYIRPDLVYPLRLEDDAFNLSVLNALQHASEASLKERSESIHQIVAREYTWDRFCQTVARGLQPYL